jgi:uncharacterized protein YlxW (UPF0749 family)
MLRMNPVLFAHLAESAQQMKANPEASAEDGKLVSLVRQLQGQLQDAMESLDHHKNSIKQIETSFRTAFEFQRTLAKRLGIL